MVIRVFLSQNHPKARAHIAYTTQYTLTPHRRQAFLYDTIHTLSVCLGMYFFGFFFRRWIFLGYLVNLFVCACVCMSVVSICAYYGAGAAHMFLIIQIPIK